MREKKIIGRKDKVCIPELAIENVSAKIDTGAYTSSIHCHYIEEIEIDGKTALCFELFDPNNEHYNYKKNIFNIYKQKHIKSSSGHTEKRYIIKTNILLFGELYPIELSLSKRGTMKYPILIGRKLLNKKFVVDTSKNNLSYKASRK